MQSLIRRCRESLVTPRRYDDERGSVYELLRLAEIGGRPNGQMFVTTAKPGQSKGHHYHTRKTEWFCVVSGDGEMVIQDVETGERDAIPVTAEMPTVIKIEPGLAHALRNVGTGELVSLVYVDEVYNPSDADTIPCRVF